MTKITYSGGVFITLAGNTNAIVNFSNENLQTLLMEPNILQHIKKVDHMADLGYMKESTSEAILKTSKQACQEPLLQPTQEPVQELPKMPVQELPKMPVQELPKMSAQEPPKMPEQEPPKMPAQELPKMPAKEPPKMPTQMPAQEAPQSPQNSVLSNTDLAVRVKKFKIFKALKVEFPDASYQELCQLVNEYADFEPTMFK